MMFIRVKKNIRHIIYWLVSVILSAVLLLLTGLYSLTDDTKAALQFIWNYRIIKENYFRTTSDEKLFENATLGMISALDDPHSALLSGKKFDLFQQSASGEYGGIGVVIGKNTNGNIHILSVFPTSSAKKIGLQSEDELLAVDGEPISGTELEDLAKRLRGKAGTHVQIEVKRGEKKLCFDVERSNIVMPTVQSSIIKNNIGYIHIYSFTKHTPEELSEQLKTLKTNGAEKLIIDLRMNPGGLVDSVVAVANQLLTEGTIVSYHTKDGHAKKFDIIGIDRVMPMVILIDEHSASASEILAGAVQDKKEGTVIGKTSYGKGTVQKIIQTGEQSALKISIAEYRTSAGRVIDKVGIIPDIEVVQTGRIFDKNTDNVIKKAIEILEN